MDKLFCVEGDTEIRCKDINLITFKDESDLLALLLHLFKTQLPSLLSKFKDCQGNPMQIAPECIHITPGIPGCGNRVFIAPIGENPDYGENFTYETNEYSFEIYLEVATSDYTCNIWNLIKLKQAVKVLLVNAEDLLFGNEFTMDSNPRFRNLGTEKNSNQFIRSGIWSFNISTYNQGKEITL